MKHKQSPQNSRPKALLYLFHCLLFLFIFTNRFSCWVFLCFISWGIFEQFRGKALEKIFKLLFIIWRVVCLRVKNHWLKFALRNVSWKWGEIAMLSDHQLLSFAQKISIMIIIQIADLYLFWSVVCIAFEMLSGDQLISFFAERTGTHRASRPWFLLNFFKSPAYNCVWTALLNACI